MVAWNIEDTEGPLNGKFYEEVVLSGVNDPADC